MPVRRFISSSLILARRPLPLQPTHTYEGMEYDMRIHFETILSIRPIEANLNAHIIINDWSFNTHNLENDLRENTVFLKQNIVYLENIVFLKQNSFTF